jgi:curved DNA-binding protein CbpA
VSPTATPDEITRAYRTRVRESHPDTRTTPRSTPLPAADEQLERVLTAYALLRDPERRAQYDRQTARDNRARTIVSNSAGTVRILGLTFGFKIGRQSE